ncbi:MAG: GIY-YIG nuclease family protein [Victivallaceae bacterium]|nr:GIY-YIG nuclease family protein [Victivallaceae bacterium]
MDKDKLLDEIFASDPLGLLNVKPASAPARTADERLLASFQEINDFYEQHNREPQAASNVQEHKLYSRLKNLRNDDEKISMLEAEDKHNLLKVAKKEIKSLNDVLNDDSLGILNSDAESIFTLKHVQVADKRENADFVARRKACKNFAEYADDFKTVQKDLQDGKRKIIKFGENQIQEGAYFIMGGILLYVAKLYEMTINKNGKRDGRTLLIFENGTESRMKYRTLGKGLFENGRAVTFTDEEVYKDFYENMNVITEEDEEAGFIYVLKSRSQEPGIRSIENLYKIGYSKIEVEERIKNAEQEPTYLMAPVSIVTVFQCYNLNPQKLEQLLHNFFGSSCLNIDVFDSKGIRHTPREWFIAPLKIIEQVIDMIKTGQITEFRYNPNTQMIELL